MSYQIRTAVFWLVLTLAAGPSAALVCQTWCDPQAVVACHHQGLVGSTRVTGDDACDDVVLGAAIVLPEEVRRGLSTPSTSHTALIPQSQFALSMTRSRPRYEPRWSGSIDNRPRSTALRI